MKRRDKRFISIITSVALTITAVLSSSSMMVTGKEMNKEDLKQELRTKMNNYLSSHEKNLKGDSVTSGALNENGTTEDLEEEVRVIVKLEESPAIKGENSEYTDSVKEKEEEVKKSQSSVISKAESITGNTVRRSFGYLVNGFSINVKKKNIEDLKAIDGVRDVVEVKRYKPDMEFAKKITGAENVWKDYNYKGEGMVVSIIDTGIDYTHKDLQNIDKENLKISKANAENEANTLEHGKYFTDKVPYGHNYADNNDDVIDTGSQHGMHVAGIVAANGADEDTSTFKAIKGVAPEAQLLAMKVFTNNQKESSAYDDDVIAAIEDSVKLGADVINMSLGSSSGFSSDEDPQNEAVKNATDAGTICVISAGNSQTSTTRSSSNAPENILGIKDTSIVGSPSTAKGALSVASMENDKAVFDSVSYENPTGEKGSFAYSNAGGDTIKLLATDYTEVVNCSKGIVNNGQDDFAGKDISGKIALIERGTSTFQSKYENALERGAKGVIIYNHEDGGDVPMGMSVGTVTAPVFSLGHSDGLKLIEEIEKGNNKFKFSAVDGSSAVTNPAANNMSAFTSWGATSDLEFKPEITAPGGQIYSLANGDSYQVMSGTSMAAPHTAGSEALILQGVKKKNLGLSGSNLVRFAKNTAMNTARPMIENEEDNVPFSTRRQGAGLVDIENAIKNNVLITYKDGKSAAALKEVGQETTFELTIKNYGDKDATYDLSKENVYGEVTDENGAVHEVQLGESVAKFDNDKVTVKANSETSVKVTLNIDSKEQSEQFVEGYLHFNSEDTENPSLVVPFMGFYGDWSKENIVDVPNYLDDENNESLLGTTGLVGKSAEGASYLGTVLKNDSMFVDKNAVAFSPNDDGANDSVIPAVYMLRNSRYQKIQVVDNNGNVIRDLGESEFVRKNTLEDYISGTKKKLLSSGSWDGTTYNMVTGKYETVQDGQYFIRLTNVTELENSKEQVLDLPVKVDNALPTVEVKNVEKYVDAEGKTHYKLMWTAKDNEAGSGIAPVYLAAINGQTVDIDPKDVTEVNGTYSVEIPFVDGEVNDIQLACSDNAGNMNVDEKKLKSENLKTIAFSELKDGLVVGNSSLIDGEYLVSGTAGDNLGKLIINDTEVKFEDNYFEQLVKLVEGENSIKVYAEDKNGKVVLDTEYKVTLDTKAPEVTLDKNIGDTKPYYTTNESEVEFKATVNDKTNVKMKLDNEPLTVIQGQASGKLKLKNGINKFNLTVTDEGGNETVKDLIVVKGNEAGAFDVSFDNMSNFQLLNDESVKDGVFKVEGHVSKNTKVLKLNGDAVTINKDLTFTYDLKVKEGLNVLSLYAENEEGKVISNYGLKLYYDKSAPKVKVDLPVSREDGNIYTNKSPFTVSGTATDNIFGYNVYINGNSIMALEKYPVTDEKKLLREFSKDIDIKEGLNTINISAVDEFDNKYSQDVNVVLDTVAPAKPTIKLSETNVTNKSVKATIDTDEKQVAEIDYSFDGENYIKYTGEFTIDTSSKVYAKVIDYAGNISEVAESNVEIDTVAPKVEVTGVEEGMTYYKKLKPEINVDDKEAKLTVLLNGKEYDGKELDTEGKYELQAYAVDKAGNKSNVVNKVFTIDQSSIETIEGGKSTLVNNGVKPADGNDYVFNSTQDNLIASIEDTTMGSTIITPNTKVTLPKELLKSLNLAAVNLNENLYEDTEALKGLKSIGKVLELKLSSVDGKVLNDFGDNKIKVEVKLSKEDLKDLDTKKLTAYYFNEDTNAWEAIGGDFLNDTNTFVFETNHLTKFTIAEKVASTSNSGDGTFNGSDNGGNTPVNNTSNQNGTSNLTGVRTGDKVSILFIGSLLMAAATSFVALLSNRRRKNN